jgi:hypothetical protein
LSGLTPDTDDDIVASRVVLVGRAGLFARRRFFFVSVAILIRRSALGRLWIGGQRRAVTLVRRGMARRLDRRKDKASKNNTGAKGDCAKQQFCGSQSDTGVGDHFLLS